MKVDRPSAKEIGEISAKLYRIKKKPPGNLDLLFEEAHEEVFSKTDCLTCANCCKTASPMLFEKDIERLSKHLKLKPGEFIVQYLYIDTDGIFAFRQTPCPFLGNDNYCSVYEHRPKACREYPHTNMRKMHTLLTLAEKNLQICPAVAQIVQRIENA
jgi:Fe-S-cluster containining protein